MSLNDYVAACNNSVNDNMYNATKARSKVHQLKTLLQPVLALLRGRRRRSTYRKEAQPEYFHDDAASECEQNRANELLEQRIFDEIDCCPDLAAVPVYDRDGRHIVPVSRGQRYVPVHFARTDAGTFFWTSVSAADSDICAHGDRHAFSGHQVPELQTPCDRWAQA